jgi:hypothetical protein
MVLLFPGGDRRFFREQFAILGNQLVRIFDQLGKRIASIPLEPDYTTAKTRFFDDVQSAVARAVNNARRFPASDRIEP